MKANVMCLRKLLPSAPLKVRSHAYANKQCAVFVKTFFSSFSFEFNKYITLRPKY